MGSYNKILVECESCNERTVFQSKGGDCSFTTYNFEHLPLKDFLALLGEEEYCNNCGLLIRIPEIEMINGAVVQNFGRAR